jgi:hypothetical protein
VGADHLMGMRCSSYNCNNDALMLVGKRDPGNFRRWDAFLNGTWCYCISDTLWFLWDAGHRAVEFLDML